MATAYLEEYERTLYDDKVGEIAGPLLAKSNVTVTGAAADIATLNSRTRFIVIRCDAAIQWEEGADADADSRYLPKGEGRYAVTGGNTISVILKQ